MATNFKSKWIVLASLGLFIISLPFECYCASGCANSLVTLCIGVFGIFTVTSACLSGICWMANPLLIIAWCTAKASPIISLLSSIGSFVLSLSFYFMSTIYADEGGHYKPIEAYKAGYWLWLASSTVMLAGNIVLRMKNRRGLRAPV